MDRYALADVLNAKRLLSRKSYELKTVEHGIDTSISRIKALEHAIDAATNASSFGEAKNILDVVMYNRFCVD